MTVSSGIFRAYHDNCSMCEIFDVEHKRNRRVTKPVNALLWIKAAHQPILYTFSNVGNNIGILGSPVCLAIVDLLDHLFRIGDVPFKFWLLFVKLGRIRILHKLRVYLCECVLIMRLLLFELLALLYLLKQL